MNYSFIDYLDKNLFALHLRTGKERVAIGAIIVCKDYNVKLGKNLPITWEKFNSTPKARRKARYKL